MFYDFLAARPLVDLRRLAETDDRSLESCELPVSPDPVGLKHEEVVVGHQSDTAVCAQLLRKHRPVVFMRPPPYDDSESGIRGLDPEQGGELGSSIATAEQVSIVLELIEVP